MEKKILIISRALTHGGAEKTAATLATQLSKELNVTLLVINRDRITYDTDAKTIFLDMPIKKEGSKLIWYFKFLKKVSKIKRDLKITHTISFLLEPDIANILTGKKDYKIISVRNKQSELSKGLIRKWRDYFIFKKANKIVAISEMVKQDLIDYFSAEEEKIEVIYNMNNKVILEKKAEEKTDLEKYGDYILNIGRLSKQKGQWHLIRAFSEVVKEHPNLNLVILGEGELSEYLNELIVSLNLTNNVFLLGYKSNPYPYIKNAKLFVFSSLFEGLGNSIIESLTLGTPVISTDCDSGPRELLDPLSFINTGKASKIEWSEYGVLTPILDGKLYLANDSLTFSEIELGRAISELSHNKELLNKYEKKSIDRRNDFENEKIVFEWINLLEN